MARVMKPLSDTQVKKAKPNDKDYELSDGNGLYLRVRSSGTKTWIFNYHKPSTKKRTNLSLGSFPDVSLADARLKREEARKLLSQGNDPKLYKDVQKAKLLNTFKLVAEQWFNIKKTTVSESYATNIWNSFVNHIFPVLGNLNIILIFYSL
jgi:hypothetical protein